jgi:ABC-type sugar transport system substrate-binding protein
MRRFGKTISLIVAFVAGLLMASPVNGQANATGTPIVAINRPVKIECRYAYAPGLAMLLGGQPLTYQMMDPFCAQFGGGGMGYGNQNRNRNGWGQGQGNGYGNQYRNGWGQGNQGNNGWGFQFNQRNNNGNFGFSFDVR